MACDAQSVETLLVSTDKYYSLSQRQWLEWLAQLVINAAGITVTAAINLAATNKMAALSDRNLEECRIAAFTAALFDAQSIINEIATQKYPSLDRHDLMCATIAAYCAAAGGSAQTVETLSVGNGYFKLSQRDDTLAIDAVICAANSVNCTNVTAVALSPGITGMSDRHLKEVICSSIHSAAGPPVPPCQVPTGLAAVWNVDNTTTITWDALPVAMTSTKIWKSTDNIGFVLADTVAAPTHTDTLPVQAFPLYIKLRFNIGATHCNFTASVQANHPINPNTPIWVAQVVTNGGAVPSVITQTAINDFYNAIDACGITSKILDLCMLVPDSLIAARTPLIAGSTNPWTNTAFVGGDLSVNGLHGDGATKFLDPGIAPFTAGPQFTLTSCCLFFYAYTANSTASGTEIGTNDLANDSFFLSNFITAGLGTLSDLLGAGCRLLVASPGNGFYMASRIAAGDHKIYFANSGTAWSAIASNALGSSGFSTVGYLVFAANLNGVPGQPANSVLSCVGFAAGLTTTEGQCLYNAVQACRVALGGGFR